MRNLLVFILLGLALFQFSGATELEEERDNSLFENQEDLEVQALADPNRRKTIQRGGKKRQRNKIGGERKRQRKTIRGEKKRQKKTIRGEMKKQRKTFQGEKKTRMKKRKKNMHKIKKEKRKNKNGKSPRKKVVKRNRKKHGKGPKRNMEKDHPRCVEGCSNIIIGMMKAARKQNTYIKQYNRVVNVQKQAAKKGGKKDNYGSDAADGPLALLIAAGGGDKSDMSCAGSKTNQAAINMAKLLAKLEMCEDNIGSMCNVTNMVEIKPEWKTCSDNMKMFKNMSDACLKETDEAACTCFKGIEALKDKVVACDSVEMKNAAASDLAAKKKCNMVFGECRANGEMIRPVLSACQAGGPTVEDVKKQVGAILQNAAANDAIIKKTKELTVGEARVKPPVVFGGKTYSLDTCASWAEAALAWIAAMDAALGTDISAAGITIAGTDVTCTAEDAAVLAKVTTMAAAVSKKAEEKVAILQKKLEQITGTTVSSEDALAAAVGATTAAPGAAEGMTTNSAKMRRKVRKILAEFRNRDFKQD